MARLNEALVENEEVIQRNQELHEQVLELRRAKQAEKERQCEQEMAVQDLMARVKVLESEKLELQSDLQGSNERLMDVIERSKLPQRTSWTQDSAAEEAPPLLHMPDQPEDEPWPHCSQQHSQHSDWDAEEAAMEAGSQEVQILGLQEDLVRLQLENEQLLGMCKELRSMFDAERQAAEQARREVDRLQSKLASEKMRRRASVPARSTARSSSSLSQGSDLMHQLAKASLAQEEPADSTSGSSVSAAGLGTTYEEEASLGACDWLQALPVEEVEGSRLLTHESVEGPAREEELGALPDQPWWWGRLFGSMLCCTRPPPTHAKYSPHRVRAALTLEGLTARES